jgi:hypothetical protein
MVPEEEKKKGYGLSWRSQSRAASCDGQVCNLPVKILWSFNNTVVFDNTVFILTETEIVEPEELQPFTRC